MCDRSDFPEMGHDNRHVVVAHTATCAPAWATSGGGSCHVGFVLSWIQIWSVSGSVRRANERARSSFKPRHSISGMPGFKNSPERVYRGLDNDLGLQTAPVDVQSTHWQRQNERISGGGEKRRSFCNSFNRIQSWLQKRKGYFRRVQRTSRRGGTTNVQRLYLEPWGSRLVPRSVRYRRPARRKSPWKPPLATCTSLTTWCSRTAWDTGSWRGSAPSSEAGGSAWTPSTTLVRSKCSS